MPALNLCIVVYAVLWKWTQGSKEMRERTSRFSLVEHAKPNVANYPQILKALADMLFDLSFCQYGCTLLVAMSYP